MSPTLPVKLFPLAARSVSPGGLVVAVLLGLAIYKASKSKTASTPAKQAKL